MPSPSKSALVTDSGLAPVATSVRAEKLPSPSPASTETTFDADARDREVTVAVVVEVGARHGRRPVAVA